MQNGEKRKYIQQLLNNLALTLQQRQAKRELNYKSEYTETAMKEFIKTSMAGLDSWLRREK